MTGPWEVFGFALLTAAATGLGALPFLAVPSMSRSWLGISNALAAGLMIAASVGLVLEGWHEDLGRTVGGAAAGLVFIVISQRFLGSRKEIVLGRLTGDDAMKALLIVGVMTLHSVTEGVGVGVSFGGGEALGLFIATAIAVHNIPEGLAISLVLVPRGTSVGKAAGWSVFSSLPQPLLAVPAFLFVEHFRPFLPVGLGFAAGAMLWMVASELLPDALEETSRRVVVPVTLVSAVAMMAFQFWLRG